MKISIEIWFWLIFVLTDLTSTFGQKPKEHYNLNLQYGSKSNKCQKVCS